ncbi:heavy metal-associated isoprenylated plant protein 20-like isoform X1 [Rosa rugosa]|uniref:heavy metal-associated isoprenylated plant protein 20-like isoform X1 n=1 Tax=Rosa rugosa TaxID=74645 RepID=UPI002B40D5D4|nr:heavy metal-associated isoprenylated plant protein 20-like isoform X1 [Rosa rugosa]
MGVLDYLSDYFTISSKPKKKRKAMQTVEIKVKMDCDGCERRVKSAVSNMKVLIISSGAKQVEVNRKQSRVTVTGYVEPNKVLKKVKSTGKKAEIWPYVPYNLVAYPYVAGAYDKKAPSGYVRNVPQAVAFAPDDQYSSLFSDDNPHACAIM